jgi:hypothetical protein
MPIEIQRLESDITVLDGELPLSEEQIQMLVERVCTHLEAKQREKERTREATALRRSAAPPLEIGR